ncbi:MAG TPA: hypothetical protein VII06_31475 [Chloroflexota bacterium]|jgi:hypothetical protein
MSEKRRWPTLQEYLDNAKRGFIDDRMDAVPPYDFDPDEILSAEEEAELKRLIAEEKQQRRH